MPPVIPDTCAAAVYYTEGTQIHCCVRHNRNYLEGFNIGDICFKNVHIAKIKVFKFICGLFAADEGKDGICG